MATVGQIDTFALKMYPKATNTNQTDRISFLNDIHNDVFIELSNYNKNPQVGTIQLVTLSPYAITITDTNSVIKDKLYLSNNNTNSILGNDENVLFSELGNLLNDYKYYYNITSKTSIVIIKNGILANDLIDKGFTYLKYIYYPKPIELTSINDVPTLDSKYHNLLKFKLIQRLASQGENPDSGIADFWETEYKEFIDKIKEDSSKDNSNNSISDTIEDNYGW